MLKRILVAASVSALIGSSPLLAQAAAPARSPGAAATTPAATTPAAARTGPIGTASATTPAPRTPTPGLAPYRINPGDELEIYVWGEERLQRSTRVLPDGSFAFPLVGHIDAVGKLPSEIEAAITRGLRSQYRDDVPQVTVSVRSPAGLQFSVAGKVRGPGAFTPGRYVNLLEALVMAGGPADFADLGNVTVLRKENGRLTAIKVRMTDIMRGNATPRELAALPIIASGDSVIVP